MRLDCTSETAGQVLSCKDSACTDCQEPFSYPGGCDDFVNSIHSCAANKVPAESSTPAPAPAYGVRMRWIASDCEGDADSVDYWPLDSPFADEGTGSCVDVPLADGGHAYYTYSTSATIPEVPSSWSPYYAVETFYDNETLCDAADPSTVELTTITSSDACIFMVLSPPFLSPHETFTYSAFIGSKH
jgi:hypothetical protein